MKPRTLLILSAVALALGAFVFFWERDLPSTDERAGLAKKVLRLEDDAVRSLLIEWDGHVLRLVREPPKPAAEEETDTDDDDLVSSGAGDGWRITAPLQARADGAAVDGLLASLTGLEASRTLDDFDRAELGLDQPRARVTLVSEDGQSVLEIGAEVPASSDMVVAVAGKGSAYVVGAGVFDDLTKEPGEWRDKKLFLATRGDVERVTLEAGGNRVLLARRGDDFWIESPLTDLADDQKINSLMSALTGARVSRFLDDTLLTPEGIGLEPPAGVVEAVLEGEEQPFRLELGVPVEEDGKTVYGSAGGQRFEIETALLDSLAVAPADWRSRSWTSLQAFKIESARFERTEGAVEVRRDGADWKRGDDRIAYSTVSDLLYAVTEAEGEEVVERAEAEARGHDLETPRLSITLGTTDSDEQMALFDTVDALAAATSDRREAVLLIAADDADEIVDQLQKVADAEVVPDEDEGDEGQGEEDGGEGGG